MCNRLPEINKNGDAGIFPVYYSLNNVLTLFATEEGTQILVTRIELTTSALARAGYLLDHSGDEGNPKPTCYQRTRILVHGALSETLPVTSLALSLPASGDVLVHFLLETTYPVLKYLISGKFIKHLRWY